MDYQIPDFIIDKLIEIEREKQERKYERPRLEAPPPMPWYPPPPEEEEEVKRGPIIIDIDTYEIIDEDNE